MVVSAAPQAGAAGVSRKAAIGVWLLALAIGVYFIIDNVPRYLLWSADSYGAYYWPRAELVLPHVLGGLVAIIIGPFQLWPGVRSRFPKIHRISGRAYLGAVLVGALAGMSLALTSGVSTPYAGGLFMLAVVWLVTSGMALVAIKRRNFIQHKQWMIRSYVVTFAFVIFRILDDTLVHLSVGERSDNLALLAWACWAVPLVLAEVAIQGRQVFAAR